MKDRFGDYGLVGAIFWMVESGAVSVDTFLLSCRALGRGVEYRMLAELGRAASNRGLGGVHVRISTTGRNQPALDFLMGIGAEFKMPAPNGYLFTFTTEFAEALTYDPRLARPAGLVAVPSDSPVAGSAALAARRAPKRLNHLTTELYRPELILDAVNGERKSTPEYVESDYVAPRTPTEKTLASIFSDILGVEQVGVYDDFFDLGGHSLLATQLISHVRMTFGIDLPLSEVFTDIFTVESLAMKVEKFQIEAADSNEVGELLDKLNKLTDDEITSFLRDVRSEMQ